jgi:hypothetical protein
MSLLHNAEADFAASELARMFVGDPKLCYDVSALPAGVSATASHEASASPWPKADGVVSILETGTQKQRDVAVEYKRQHEGIHGLLTAIGQAQGYIHKGYHGAAIVIPSQYPSHDSPAIYVKGVLDMLGSTSPIGVFRYEEPDTSSPVPFANRIHCVRPFVLSARSANVASPAGRPKTQWVHMREGSTTRDAFFRFLQTAKRMSATEDVPMPKLPPRLVAAIKRLAPDKDPQWYLSNTADDKLLTRVWRAFWFEWILTPDVIQPWVKTSSGYEESNAFTRILKDNNTGYSQIFEGRTGSLKQTIVDKLNAGTISEDEGWEQFVDGIKGISGQQNKQGVRERAHSYREDLDSSLAHLKWIEPDGRPTDCGYHYAALCERYGGANSRAAVDYVGATLLQIGHYGSFLHYVHRLSERKFSSNPLEFTQQRSGRPAFTESSYASYLAYLESELADNLKVMRKVSGRERPRQRTPFQAELTLLRNYGFVSKSRYRLGVGIPIDWERVQEAMNIEL